METAQSQAAGAGRQSDSRREYPQFVLPLDETTQIVLVSNDVVHTFYIPAFNFGRYALPGCHEQLRLHARQYWACSPATARSTAAFTTPRCSSA